MTPAMIASIVSTASGTALSFLPTLTAAGVDPAIISQVQEGLTDLEQAASAFASSDASAVSSSDLERAITDAQAVTAKISADTNIPARYRIGLGFLSAVLIEADSAISQIHAAPVPSIPPTPSDPVDPAPIADPSKPTS